MPTISINKKQMYYYEQGQGFPLVFGHSFLWDTTMWQPTIEALSANYRCIVPDLWAHGLSDLPDYSPYPMEKIAEDMMSFLGVLELECFVIIGLSAGGMWGTHLALNHPESVAGLVLMDTYVGSESKESRTYYFQMMAAVEQAGLISPLLIEQLTPLFFSPLTMETKPDFVNTWQQKLLSLNAEKVSAMFAVGSEIVNRNSLLNRLKYITCPCLIMVGENDQVRPLHESIEMANHLKNAKLEIIPHAGHISNVDQPEVVNAILKQFLSEAIKS
ncbi:alpha/beta fold hydrolase [Cylindrospermum sp. FACHB-282]|uniref:alpha/beta fold hydrolase n=1 Tax=Cylindrospermum sp. FACHB-282 TaxID=2692794 RepID=UPI001683A738|nr:alpha/beta hydrolase [Cylindrospermum sp. FACHB-282]MBD2384233.1 alpha/beta hydrolase [Cylindrospermum sp. FACHB-282]